MGFGPVIEDMARLIVFFSVCQFVANSKRWTGALSDKYITLAKPGSVLIVYVFIFLALFHQIQIRTPYVFRKHYTGLLHMSDHSAVQACVCSSTTDGTGEINLSHTIKMKCIPL